MKITRFAPSPTNYLHIGSIKAMLFPYWYAKKHNGKFILRIDNTDKIKCKPEYIASIFDDLKWLNIQYDITFQQSDRYEQYEAIHKLLEQHGYVYKCYETPEVLDRIRLNKRTQCVTPIFTKADICEHTGQGYWRFDLGVYFNNHPTFQFVDGIMGNVSFGREWSDPIIKKTDNSFSYLFASVVDDLEYKVTDIIRGNDHIPNTIIQKIMGDVISTLLYGHAWQINFSHFPLFLESGGQKVSKRTGNNAIKELRYLEPWSFWSVINYLGGSHEQIFSTNPEDYIQNFHLNTYSRCQSVFEMEQLERTNKHILPHLSSDNLMALGVDLSAWNLLKNNIISMDDFHKKLQQIRDFPWGQYKELILDPQTYIKNNGGKEFYYNFYTSLLGEKQGPPLLLILDYVKINQF